MKDYQIIDPKLLEFAVFDARTDKVLLPETVAELEGIFESIFVDGFYLTQKGELCLYNGIADTLYPIPKSGRYLIKFTRLGMCARW